MNFDSVGYRKFVEDTVEAWEAKTNLSAKTIHPDLRTYYMERLAKHGNLIPNDEQTAISILEDFLRNR